MLHRLGHVSAIAATMLTAAASVRAADIHLKAQASVQGQTVHLADVAEIHGGSPDEARQLSQIELFAVPPKEQYITARQVREALLARGVDLRQHTLSGASMIELGPSAGPAAPGIFARRAIPGNDGPEDRASSPTATAIVRFLKSQVDSGLPWQVQLVPAERAVDQAGGPMPMAAPPAGATDVAVAQSQQRPERGSVRPWLGVQQFLVRWTAGGRRREGIVAAEINVPATIVVAARALPRGTILQADDLKTKAAGGDAGQGRTFQFIEDAMGKEIGRALRAGQAVDADSVESPDLVRRGEKVSIVVNHNGVRVRTEGRARESGKRGDAVMVESAARRNALQAVVTGVNEVEVEVGAAVVTRSHEESGQRF